MEKLERMMTDAPARSYFSAYVPDEGFQGTCIWEKHASLQKVRCVRSSAKWKTSSRESNSRWTNISSAGLRPDLDWVCHEPGTPQADKIEMLHTVAVLGGITEGEEL